MLKKIIVLLLSLFCAPLFAFADAEFLENVETKGSPMELSVYGGVSSSRTEKTFEGVDMDFGGSGYALGFTGLGRLNSYFAAGVDFSYLNNGYGKAENIGISSTELRLEHFTPLFLGKLYLLPPEKSLLSVYIPAGAGFDFTRVSKRIDGDNANKKYNTLAGFAAAVGLGAELNFYNDTFVSAEGRYYRSFYLGSNDYGLSVYSGYAVLVKFGIRFSADMSF